MSVIHWTSPINGTWNTTADWSTDSVPGGSDNVYIDATGATYSVDSTQNNAAGTLTIVDDATLIISNNTSFTIYGAISNAGTISLDSTGQNTMLALVGSGTNVTLSGGGQIILSDNADNLIEGTNNPTLTNVNNTISGAGSIVSVDGTGLTLINEQGGIINATGTINQLIISPSEVVQNSGTLEDTGSAGLLISQTTVDNAATGIILAAGAGSHVDLQGATISGGTLETTGGGVIDTLSAQAANLLDGTSTTLNNTGNVVVNNGTNLFLQGVINNTGTISVNGTTSGTAIMMQGASTNVMLEGSGQIILSDDANNLIEGTNNATLTNVDNTISGAGTINGTVANAGLTVVNENFGVIDATGTNPLIITANVTGVTNTGTLEATGPGGLALRTTVANAGGLIEALNGSHVDLQGAAIEGGTLATANGGVIDTLSAQAANLLDGTSTTLNNTANVVVNNGTNLTIAGVIDNTGTISLNGSTSLTAVMVGGSNATLEGGGQIVLSDNTNNLIEGTNNPTLTNVNNTISGAGSIISNEGTGLTFINGGVVDATGANPLILETDETIINNGALEEDSSHLDIFDSVSGTGQMLLSGSNGTLELHSSTSEGITFTPGASGTLQLDYQGNSVGLPTTGTIAGFVEGDSIVFSGYLATTKDFLTYEGYNATNNTTTVFVSNDTSVGVDTVTGFTLVLSGDYLSSGFELTGIPTKTSLGLIYTSETTGPTVAISSSGGATNVASQTVSGTVLENLVPVGTTVTLYDSVNGGSATEIGTATVSSAGGPWTTSTPVMLSPGTNSIVAEDTDTAGNTGMSTAVVYTLETTQAVAWANDVNGNWTTAADWTPRTVPGINDNVSIAASGTKAYKVTSAANVTVNSILTGATATLDLTGGTFTTLNGTGSGTNAGTVTVGGAAALDIDGAFVNAATGLISAAALGATVTLDGGSIADGTAKIVAGATLQATGGPSDPSALTGMTVTDKGTLLATNDTTLTLADTTVSASGGVVEASDSGNATIALSNATIDNGTLETIDNGVIETVAGTNSVLDAVTISAGTTVTVVDGSMLTLQGEITDDGSIAVDSTGDQTAVVVSASGATLAGGGTVSLSDNGSNIILPAAPGAKLTNDDTIFGAGEIGNGNGDLTLANKGTIDATGANALVIDTGNTVSNTDMLVATNPNGLPTTGGLTVVDALSNSGTIQANGGNVTIEGKLTGSGQAEIFSKSMIEFESAATNGVTFENNSGDSGLLKLGAAQSFTGTVAGLAAGDGIDLANFLFADTPLISKVTGTGVAGTTTNVTIKDDGMSATLHLLNQYANQFAVTPAAYTLTADSGSSAAGTLFELATPHSV